MAENTRRDAGHNKAYSSSNESANAQRPRNGLELHIMDDPGPIAPAVADSTEESADDLDATAEFPVLVLEDALFENDESAGVASMENTASARVERQARAQEVGATRRLECELERLQTQCECLLADLRARGANVEALRAESEAKDRVIRDLCRQIEERTNTQLVLENDLRQANARLAELGAVQASREIDISLIEANLHDAREAVAATEARCTALTEEKAKLSESLERYAEAAAGAQQRYEVESGVASRLRTRVQELETYIDGSKQRWSSLNEQLAEYRDWLGVSERREAWALAELSAETNARKRLTAEASELQRRLVKLVAQVAERDTAQLDVERRLEDERAAAAQLRTEIVSATERGDRALAESNALAERVTALEQALSARQQELRAALEEASQKETDLRAAKDRITRLEGLLREAAHEIDELVTALEEHEGKIDRLEADLRDRQDAIGLPDGSVPRLDPIGIAAGSEALDRPRRRATDAPGRVS
jgi:peptidoglycan hydrolase CwlO-like protein